MLGAQRELTLDEQVRYPFDAHGYTDANFIIDREHGHMCARINKGGLWRVTYIEEPNLTMEECVSRLPAKFQKILPGNPNPSQFKVEHMSPYRIHQRAAPSFRLGRFLLAGDAAHRKYQHFCLPCPRKAGRLACQTEN